MKKMARHIQRHGRFFGHHVKKHHKAYVVGGFGVYSLIKTVILVLAFLGIYAVNNYDIYAQNVGFDIGNNIVIGSSNDNINTNIKQIELFAVGDTMLSSYKKENNENFNYGKTSYIGVSKDGSVGLIKFDLSDVSNDLDIIGGELVLTRVNWAGKSFKVRSVINNEWIEGNGNDRISVTGEPSYNKNNYPDGDWYGGGPGLIEGKDYSVSNLTEDIKFDYQRQTKSFDLNEGGLDIIKKRIGDENKNKGFALVEANNRIQLGSRESATVDYRPKLILKYAVLSTGIDITQDTGVVLEDTGVVENSEIDLNEVVQVVDNIDVDKDLDIIQDSTFFRNVEMKQDGSKVKVKFDKNIKIKNKNKTDYKGLIYQATDMVQVDLALIENDVDIKYAFNIGSDDEIYFENLSGEIQNVLFHVDLEDTQFFSGEKILLYYSNDKKSWSVWGEETVKRDTEFGMYLEFEIDHMTSFVVGKKKEDEIVYQEVLDDIDVSKDKKIIKDAKFLKDVELVSSDKKIKVKIGKDIKVKDGNGKDYLGDIFVPKELDVESIAITGVDSVYVFEVGNTGEINFEYENGVSALVSMRIDLDEIILSGKNIGSGTYLSIHYSQDLIDWVFFDHVLVKDDGSGLLYVEFEVAHMTTFSLGQESYDFYICDGGLAYDLLTETELRDVHLCVGRDQPSWPDFMEYSNTITPIGKFKISFVNNYAWTLSDAYGLLTVNAYFSSQGGTANVSTTIKRPYISSASVEISSSTVLVGSSVGAEVSYHIVNSSVSDSYLKIDDSENESMKIYVFENSWDGDLYAPVALATNSPDYMPSPGADEDAVATFSVGGQGDTELHLDGVSAEVFVQIDTILGQSAANFDGRALNIYSSSDGEDWIYEQKCNITQYNSERGCFFDTYHFSYFGFSYEWHDNDDFIDQAFWDLSPTDDEIIDALYGTSTDINTAYTENWDGYTSSTCLGSMTVSHILATSIPTTLAANTIYVVASGSKTITSTINASSCSAIVSSGNLILDKDDPLNVFSVNGKSQVILDAVIVDGHGFSSYGIYVYGSSKNTTFNNIEVNNNGGTSLYYYSSTYNILNNSQIYNGGGIGINMIYGGNNMLNNVQSYNNVSEGVNRGRSERNAVNNSQIYNNGTYGVRCDQTNNGSVVSNSQIYNNSYGIGLTDCDYVKFNYLEVYNNTNEGLSLNTLSTNNLYYGDFYYWDNNGLSAQVVGTNFDDSYLSAGSAHAILGWEAGNAINGGIGPVMSYDNVTRAIDYSSNYGPFSSYLTREDTTTWNSLAKYYTYGDNIFKQVQPVMYYSLFLLLSDQPYNTGKFIAQANSWSNEYFLDDSFWGTDPSDSDIVWALYGDDIGGVDDTAYTEYWSSNDCDGSFTIVNETPGAWGLTSSSIATNKIHVLSAGVYRRDASGLFETEEQINMNSCSAIVGKGDVYLYTSGTLSTTYPDDSMILASGVNNIILDNLNIDAAGDGQGGSHTENNRGVVFLSTESTTANGLDIGYTYYSNVYHRDYSSYNYISNSSFHDASSYGLYIERSFNNRYENLTIYNNDNNGIGVIASNRNVIKDFEIYNNGFSLSSNWREGHGIRFDSYYGGSYIDTNYNILDNLLIYNNYKYGIIFNGTETDYNTINNSQIYNNSYGGILSRYGPAGQVLNNIYIYNNGGLGYNDGISFESTASTMILNNVNLYNNSQYGIDNNNSSTITYYGELKMFDNVTANTNGGLTVGFANASLGRGAGAINTDGCITCDWYTNPLGSGEYLMNTGTYPKCEYIGYLSTWTLQPDVDYIFGSLISKQEPVVEYPGTSTLTLSSDIGYNDSEYVGENDNKSSVYTGNNVCNGCDPDYGYPRNNDNFITGAFWDAGPTSCDIVAALYGTGAGDITAYTEYRNNYSDSCVFTGIGLEELTPGTNQIPNTLTANNVYVLNSGDYIYNDGAANAVNMSGCNVIVGSGDIVLYTQAQKTNMVHSDNHDFNIVDNVSIDGGGSHSSNAYGVRFYSSANGTINNSQFYNNTYGVNFASSSANGIINNSQFYNNIYGVYYYSSANGIINNSQFYNNGSYGVYFSSSANGIINNSQIYNNGDDGIYYLASDNWVLNNSQGYNNEGNGIYYESSANGIINNGQFYNNVARGNYGNIGSDGIKYYGKLLLFGNGAGFWSRGISPGIDADYPGVMEDGYISYNGCMSCAWVTNPVNSFGDYLIETGTYSNCELQGNNSTWTGTASVNYKYGINIKNQTDALVYDSSDIIFGDIEYDATKYIAELNNIGEYTGYICDCSTQTYAWDNSKFITGAFWDSSPSMCDIIAATYGTGEGDNTAYTENWSGWNNTCSWGNMNIEYVTAGNGNLANVLTANTVYVLSSGDHLVPYNGGTDMSGCNVVIGNGDVYMYSTGQIAFDGMINNSSHEFGIIDNVKINGSVDGAGGNHTANKYGIYLNGADSNTLNTIVSFNSDRGVYFSFSNKGLINNSQFYNNTYGVSFNQSDYGIINDIQAYNSSRGISFNESDYCTVDNSQFYNNSLYGVEFQTLYSGVVSNVQSYNNAVGLITDDAGYGMIINNSKFYNNNIGITLEFMNSKYYGELKMFDNAIDFDGTDGDDELLSPGLSIDNMVSGLGRTDGELDTFGCMTCDWYTNPQNSLGEFLMNTGTYQECEGRGDIVAWTSTGEVNYQYGSLIAKQETGVYYTGGNIEFSDLYYDPIKFIAEVNSLGIYTGNYMCNMCNLDDVWRDNDNFITGGFWDNSPNDCDVMRALYGTGEGDETAYTQNWSGWDYSCNWNSGLEVEYVDIGNGNLANQLTGNTVYVLSSGDHLIPYNGGVDLSGCNVVIGNGNIYMYSTGQIAFDGMINNSSHEFGIIDNVKINGTGDGAGGNHTANKYGVYFNGSDNGTVNGVEVFENDSYGIYIDNSSDYILLNEIQAYNNSYGIQFYDSNYGLLNNSQAYNNSHGVVFYNSHYGIINNSQAYNNNFYGIRIYSTNRAISNTQSYNNSYFGVALYGADDGHFWNVSIYNNNTGLELQSTSTGNKYYGELKMFDNYSNFGGTDGQDEYLTGGLSIDPELSGLGRSDGSIEDRGCMTCDWYTNPQNSLLVSLMDTTIYPTCTGRGNIVWTSTGEVNYQYGSLIAKQETGVYYTGGNIEFSDLYYDPTKFIAEVNSLGVYTGEGYACLSCDPNDTYAWDNGNFITGAFWETSPTQCDIIVALYGTGAGDETAYTENWNGWDYSCGIDNLMVEYLDEGNGTIDNDLTENTIYVLNTGDYLVPYSNGVNMNECNVIIGSGDVYMYSTGPISSDGIISNTSHEFGIIDNIYVDGEGDGTGGIHTKNHYGIYLNFADNGTVNNSQVYNNSQYGFYIASSHYEIVNNSQAYDNGHGIRYYYSNYGIINNTQSYDNNYGIIYYQSDTGLVSNVQSYNNINGIMYIDSNGGIINNTQTYSNTTNGIDYDTSNNWAVNNSQSYNNVNGISCDTSNGGIVNNTQTYNNATNGLIYISSTSGVINNGKGYNNGAYGISLDVNSTGNKYYGELKLFDNGTDDFNGTDGGDQYLTGGSSSDAEISGLGRSDGSIADRGCMTCDWYSNPQNSLGVFMINTGTYLTCTGRGNISWISTGEVNYQYGSLIAKQTTGVYYTGGNIEFSSLAFDSSKFIAEVNSLGVYTGAYSCNMEVDFWTTKTVTGDYASGGIVEYTISYGNSGVNVGTATIIETLGAGLSGINYAGVWTLSGTDFVITGISLDANEIGSVILTATVVTGVYNVTLNNIVLITGDLYDSDNTNNEDTVGFNTTDAILPVVENISPLSGASFAGTETDIIWSGHDNESGISGYYYVIDKRNGSTWVSVTSGSATATGINISSLTATTYRRKVKAQDVAGNWSAYTDEWTFKADQYPELEITKTSDDISYGYGENIIYTIDFVNTGTIIDTGIEITDTIMSGLEYVSYTYTGPSGMTFGSGINGSGLVELTWSGFDLDAGETGQIVLTVEIGSLDDGYTCDGSGNVVPPSVVVWNNDKFIDETFWEQDPGASDIIDALYGDGSGGVDTTAYTKYWNSNTCDVSQMSVHYVDSGDLTVDTMDQNNNTIYVYKDIDFYIEDILLNTCSAALGVDTSMLSERLNIREDNSIVSNLRLYNNGVAGWGLNNADNNTLYNINIDGNSSVGIPDFMVDHSNYNVFQNIKMYNVDVNLDLSDYSDFNIFNNMHIYNNNGNVTLYDHSNRNVVNNMQIHNGSNSSFIFARGSLNALNNMMLYNNDYGVDTFTSYPSLVIRNISIFNNAKGIYNDTDITYYDFLDVFGNSSDNIISNMVQGQSELSGINRWTGYQTSPVPTVDFSLMTNPQDASGYYLLDTGASVTVNRGSKSWTGTWPITYHYGTGVLKQVQPVMYSGADLVEYGTDGIDWDSGDYIGEFELYNYTGELNTVGSISTGTAIVNSVSINGESITVSSCTTGLYNDTVDFWTTKTVTGDYYSGGTVEYTISYGNSGVDVGVATIIETLGAGLSGINYGGVWTLSGTDFVITGISLDANETGSVVLTAMIVTEIVGATLNNTVNITGSEHDMNVGNNQDVVGFDTIEASFPIIENISPISGSVFDVATVNLIWSGNDETSGISGYYYMVDMRDDPLWTNITGGSELLTGITFVSAEPNIYRRYVKAQNNSGFWSDYTDMWIFEMNNYTDLEIIKTSDKTYYDQFDAINYSINVSNEGTNTINSISIADVLINGLDILDWSISGISSYNFSSVVNASGDNVLTRTGITINPGETAEIVISSQIVDSFNNPGPIQSGIAYDFDRTIPSSVVIPDHTKFTLGDKYTVSAWINPDNIADGNKGILGTYDGGGFIFALKNNIDNELMFWDVNNGRRDSGIEIIEDGSRKHVVFKCDGTNGYFYLNNVETGSVVSCTNAVTDGGNLYLGAGGGSRGGNEFDGKIFDVRIYNQDLSSGEIIDLYNHDIVNTGLVVWYKMDEMSGSKAYDSWGGDYGVLTSISYVTDDIYSFKNNLGRTEGNGSNGAGVGVDVPRNEKNILLDVLGNVLQYDGISGNNLSNTAVTDAQVVEDNTGNNSSTIQNIFSSSSLSDTFTCGNGYEDTVREIIESADGNYFYIAGTYYDYFNCFGFYIDNGSFPDDRVNTYIAKVDQNLSGVWIVNFKSDNTNVYVDNGTSLSTQSTCDVTRGDGTNGSSSAYNYAFTKLGDFTELSDGIYLNLNTRSVRTRLENSQGTQLVANSVCANYSRGGVVTLKLDKDNGNYLTGFSAIRWGGYSCNVYNSKYNPVNNILTNFSPDKGVTTWTEAGTGYYAGGVSKFTNSDMIVRSHAIAADSCIHTNGYQIYTPILSNLLSDSVSFNLGNTYRIATVKVDNNYFRGIYNINGGDNGGDQGAKLEKRTEAGTLLDTSYLERGTNNSSSYTPFKFESMVLDNSGYIYIEGYSEWDIPVGDFGVDIDTSEGASFLMRVDPDTLEADWIKYTQQRDLGITHINYNSNLDLVEIIGQFSGDNANVFGAQLSATGNSNYYVAIEADGNLQNLQKLQLKDDYDQNSEMELELFNVGLKTYVGGEFTLDNYISNTKIISNGDKDMVIGEILTSSAFEINSGDLITNITGVYIDNVIVGLVGESVIKMKFCNDPSYPSECVWQSYSSGLSWFLTTGDELKTVYAQYQIQNDTTQAIKITQATDTITLDTEAELVISKTTNNTGVMIGDFVSYRLDFENKSTITILENVDIVDTLVAGMKYISYTTENIGAVQFSTGLNVSGDTTINWSGFDLDIGATGAIILTAQVLSNYENIVQSGRAYNFVRATPSTVVVPDHADFTLGDIYTVSAWINPDDITEVYKAILGTYDGEGFIFALKNNVDNELVFWDRNNGRRDSGIEIIEDGSRKHVVFKCDGTNGYFYLNNVETGSVVSCINAVTNGGNLYLGGGGSSRGGNEFDGKITDVRIYNDVLSSVDITKIYNHQIFNDDLISRYKMDESDGTAAYDSRGNHTGVLNSISHVTDNVYSYQNYLGRTDGDGVNGAAVGVYVPRDEKNKLYDVLGNDLSILDSKVLKNEVTIVADNSSTGDNYDYVLIPSIFVLPYLFFTGSTPAGGATINYNYFNTQIHIEKEYIKDFDYIFDGTTYDIYDSGLVLMMNMDNIIDLGDVSGTTVVDLSMSNNTGTVDGASYIAGGKWNGAYDFDGIDDYITIVDSPELNLSAGNPDKTIAFRIYPEAGNSGFDEVIVQKINNSAVGWSVSFRGNIGNTIRAANRGGHAASEVQVSQSSALSFDQWYYVVATLTYNQNTKIYIDGMLDYTVIYNGTPGDITTTEDIYIGSGYLDALFDGKIDEVRIRNRELSSDEIQQNYKSNLNKYSTGDWLFTTTNSCLAGSSTYYYTGYAESSAGVVYATGRHLITDIPATSMTGWVDFDFGTVSVLNTGQSITGEYTNYVEIGDWIGNTGWYTTIQFSTQMSGVNNASNAISGENFFFAYSGLQTISGLNSDDVSINIALQNYLNIHSGPISYIERSFNSEDFMCNAGSYGDKPRLRLDVPAFQPPDTYTGTMTVDLVQ